MEVEAKITRVYFRSSGSNPHCATGDVVAEIELEIPNRTVSGDIRRVKKVVSLDQISVLLESSDEVPQ